MKYLKYFESSSSSSSAKLYHEISEDEWYLYLSGDDYHEESNEYTHQFKKDNWEPFTDKEFEEIKKLIPSASFPNWLSIPELNSCRIDSEHFSIFKLKDEWLYVSIYIGPHLPDDKMYRCDGMDGVIQLINYVNSILYNSQVEK